MPSCKKSSEKQDAAGASVPSRYMDPLPANFVPVFIQNQFRTKIELATRERYPGVEGKCAIVTGSNTGLGLEAARQLLSLGLSHLVMAVRSVDKGNEAARPLGAAHPGATIDVWPLDMESYASIQAFARRCERDLARLDMAILNAGLSLTTFAAAAATGHERDMQVNHYGTALLSLLLLPLLRHGCPAGAGPARLAVVSSVTAHLCRLPHRARRPFLASLDDPAAFAAEEQYGASKLVSQLFHARLAERVVRAGDVVVNLVDPGLTKGTGLARHATGATAVGARVFFGLAGRPVDQGAATYVEAVLGLGTESHGCFLMNAKIAPLAHWYYTDGQVLSDLIWTETIRELSFAGVDDIISSMQSSS